MRVPRIYQATTLASGRVIELTLEACHHLVRVLRLKSNAPIVVFNGEGGEYHATLQLSDKHHCKAIIGGFIADNKESSLSIHLGQGIARGEKMDFIIQKAVELGVTDITPLLSRYSPMRLDEHRQQKRLQHWQAIANHACEQCGRNQIVAVQQPKSMQAWVSAVTAGARFVLQPKAMVTFNTIKCRPSRVAVLIGPEGGISEEELTLALKHDFIPVALGPRILRTETAALATLAALQCRWGDM